jgi:ribose 5-phosphate isomerase B
MKIAIGADHAGFALKEALRKKLIEDGHDVSDAGASGTESTDYPDFAEKVSRSVAAGQAERGVLVCASGVGMSIAANKIHGVRAALGTSEEEVALTRSHNDANVLTLGAKFTSEADARRFVDIFLSTDFEGGRHMRRVEKIRKLEQEIGND